MLRKMLIGAVALVALFATPAAAQYDFNVGPGNVEPGGTITITGGSCAFNEPVEIRITQQSTGEVIHVATVMADDAGYFSYTYQVPEDAEAGVYLVEAYCGGERVASATFEVVIDVPPTTPPTGPDDIVRTGSDLNGLGLMGAGLLAAGGIILIATKARRHQAQA